MLLSEGENRCLRSVAGMTYTVCTRRPPLGPGRKCVSHVFIFAIWTYSYSSFNSLFYAAVRVFTHFLQISQMLSKLHYFYSKEN